MSKSPEKPGFRKEENSKVLETFAGAVLWLDKYGKALHVSDSFLEFFDIRKSEVNIKSWTDIDKGFSETTFSELWNKLCTDETMDWHTILQFDTKQKYQVLVEGRIVQNDLCEFACLRVSLIQELTPQLQLPHILTKSFKSASWQWNLKDSSFSITDSFYRLFSLREEEQNNESTNIIKVLQPFLSNQQLEELKDCILKLRKSQEKVEFTWTPSINDVPKKMMLKAFPIIKNNKTIAINGTVKLVEQTLKKERLNKLASTVLEQSKNLVLILNEDFNIVHANDTAFQDLGIQERKLHTELSISKIDIEQSTTQWNKHLEKLRLEKHLIFVTSFQRKDATVLPVELTATYFKDHYGELICIVAKDISEDRKRESILEADLADKTSIAHQLAERTAYLQQENSKNFKLGNIITVSKKYLPVLAKIQQVAPTLSTVLIEGETGTGKELIARAIHELSVRSKRTMIKVNCANLPKDLIESELFGHEKGAFTGAILQKKGRFELADKGTLFLDEIGEMPLQMQTRLLRVLQEGEFERVGGNKTIRVDTRIIAATNRDLKKLVAEKTFREDLYFRLHVFPIYNIPLRERKEDIKPLAYYFLERYSKKMNKDIQTIHKKDLTRLRQYSFPGNIRELENIIERSVILTTGSTLSLDYWQPQLSDKLSIEKDFVSFEEMQKNYIIEALEKTKWKISGKNGAAQLLGMKDQTLFSKMRKFGISRN